ncbi:MAG TPA: hypothetical protein VGQ86_00370 [Candidatus Limnocylindria bacterium]|nr:hypothetical protein [Candidatus Limnocylindria bacterium]
MRALVEPRSLPVQRVVVPVVRLDRPTLGALAFARAISTDVTAVHFARERLETLRVRERWRTAHDGVELDVIATDDGWVETLLAYLDERARRDRTRPTTVVLPRLLGDGPWWSLVSGVASLWLEWRLRRRPRTIVVTVPYRADLV